MKKLIFLTGILFFLSNCSSKQSEQNKNIETIEVKDDAGKVVEKFTKLKTNGLKEGPAFEYFENGKVSAESFYKNDNLHGERVMYFENGQKQYIEQYKNGAFDGPYLAFYESGEKELEGNYVKGIMNGDWKRYYKNGQLMEVVAFSNNDENGPFIEYYENGNLKAKGTYLDGDNEHGPLEMYNEEGILIKKMNCDKGICRTSWTIDGEKGIPN